MLVIPELTWVSRVAIGEAVIIQVPDMRSPEAVEPAVAVAAVELHQI